MRSVFLVGLFAVLGGCGGGSGDPAAGEVVYTRTCGTCHGADGLLGVDGAADLTFEIPDQTDDQLESVVMNGFGDMPAQDVTADEWPDLLAYLRETFPSGS